MILAAHLRRQAQSKRKLAAHIRQVVPSLSLAADRAMMAIQLRDLEDEAAALEAEALARERKATKAK